MPVTPDDRDEPVGATLAHMRRAKHMTGAKLAALVGMSQPKISRIERGKGIPDAEDIGTIARALGANEARVQELRDRASRAHDRMTDWRPASDSLVDRQRTMTSWEATATVIRCFEPAMVPGLLQTNGYANAALRGFQRVAPLPEGDLTESAVLAAVSARIRRQEALAQQSKSFHFILAEAALRSPLCSPAEMLAQINHLREVAERKTNVSITVVPDDAPAAIPRLHGFTLLDDDMVIIDVCNTGLIFRSRRDVDSYRRVFGLFEEHATDIEPTFDKYLVLYLEQLRKPPEKRPCSQPDQGRRESVRRARNPGPPARPPTPARPHDHRPRPARTTTGGRP